MSRPIAAFVSTRALASNLEVVRRRAPGSRVWAVVKANAYGHSLRAALRGFAAADGFALIEFEAALALRKMGWERPILMLEGAFEAADVERAAANSLHLVVHSAHQVEWLRGAQVRPVAVWIKVDTGLNRLGFPVEDLSRVKRELSAMPAVASVSVMSHFADADRPGGTGVPEARFDAAVHGQDEAHLSLANSAAVLSAPSSHRDWVRAGIMLYGGSPFAGVSAAQLGLQPAMSLRSGLIAVRALKAGDAVGYGGIFVAPGPMRIGIVAGGYADGYPRQAPTGTPIAVAGVRTRTVGRVSMDMIAVDLTEVPGAEVGSMVELWGSTVAVDEVATHAGTIGYELLCALAPRVPLHILED
jgi:alanine racemase